ncbi:MAG: AAA family ATPase [Pseudomonadota bacterium]
MFGASGSGTSTLGRALADALASQHFDTDDFVWTPSDPPFQCKRPETERLTLMENLFLPRRDWVLSGALDNWGDAVAARLTLAVRLTLDPDIRRARLEMRQAQRCGCAQEWGKPLCPSCQAFLSWTDAYEQSDHPGPTLAKHVAWAKTLPCPVIVLDSQSPVPRTVEHVMEALDHLVPVA